jgi:hypothetical protein
MEKLRNVYKILVGTPLCNLDPVGKIHYIKFELGCVLISFDGGVFHASSGSLKAREFLAHEYRPGLKKTLYHKVSINKECNEYSI